MRSAPFVIAAALGVAACSGSDGSEPPTSDVTTTTESAPTTTTTVDDELVVDPDSHTVAALRSVADYEQLAVDGIGGQSVLKFSITEFASEPEIVWLDPGFYTLHDEWYWFQLLNGTSVRGFDTAPVVDGPRFDTVDDVYAWAAERPDALPLDLRFTSQDRLYSPMFYDVALEASPDRRLGLGALLRVPDPVDGGDRWIIELEFSDAVTLDHVETYFDLVGASTPAEIAEALQWVPRSRAQELVAAELEAAGGRDRVVTYDELAEPGATQVYAPGIAAGRLLLVTEGGRWSLSDAGPDDIVAIESAPDDLPPGNGLITGTPQTPLAHVNVLALNRRIPNAYLQGLADDPTLSQLGRVRAPVMISATADGELRVLPLTDEEFAEWRRLRGTAPVAVDAVDRTTLPFTRRIDDIDTSISATELRWLKPAIGGKAAGFVELATPGSITMPLDPTVITVRAYLDHADGFADEIDALVAHARDPESSMRSRFLLLEGRADYDERFTTADDRSFADEFVADVDPTLARVVAADGFRRMFRDRPIDPSNLGRITAELTENFAGHAPEQGLRFRSSSSVEDIEGFNGAGLYDSNTGFLDPTVLADPDDHDRTIERALLRTWSSYWSATAFEERERENVDHASGAMAVLVHARFDDPLELANGVAVVTVAPDPDTAYSMVLNTQLGDTSVTNAQSADQLQPEVVSVTLDEPGAAPVVERLGASTLSPDAEVLDDDAVLELFAQLRAVADSWLTRENRDLPAAQQRSSLTLDVEYRLMDAGWPALADGSTLPSRMVVKQARTLDPGLRAVPAELLDFPIPRDVLAHAASVVEIDCTLAGGDPSVWYAVTTDPLARIDFGFDERPLIVRASGEGAGADSEDFVGCPETEILTTPQRYLQQLLVSR